MKKLLAIFAVLALLTSFGYAQTTQDNCHASAQGTFSFTVEEAITVTVEVGEVDLGGVCPGCYVNFEMGDKCLIWNVDGGDQCYWEIESFDGGKWPEGTKHEQTLQVGQDGQFVDYVIGDDLLMGEGWQVRKCVTHLEADCNIAPDDYEVVETVYVEYTCYED